MTETQINEFLLKTRQIADRMKDKKSGDILLNIGTLLFDKWKLATGHTNHRVVCGCGRWLRTGDHIEFYNKLGSCHWCEHIQGEMLDYERGEYEE